MNGSTITLRRGPDAQDTYSLVESDNRFVVHFKTNLPGGTAAKSMLRLPLMFGRRLHTRKMPLPPKVAMFEVRKDEAASHLAGYGDDVLALRDASMNYIRSTIGRDWSQVTACYHTYTRQLGDDEESNRDNEIFPSGQLFLEFHATIPPEEQRQILAHYKLIVERAIVYWPGAFVVRVSQETGASPARLAQELQTLTYTGRSPGRGSGAKVVPVFDYADPLFHRRRAFQTVPPDGLFQWQWYLHNDGSDGGVVGADIAVAEAWDYTQGDPSVKIAVIDDGFELEHHEVGGLERCVAPLNAMTGTPDVQPTPGADEWHGTPVLGLICAAHNGRGVCGVAPGCTFIPIKLEALSDDEAEARAFDHAVKHGAAVINCSWGPYDDYSRRPWPVPRIVSLAIDNAYRNDVCVVFAAGNGNEEVANDGYASHPNVIAVGASTDQNTRAYYSDYGQAVWVCAPSSGGKRGVVTTDLDDGGDNPLGNYSNGFGGTSSAAPLVSGVIALMQSAYVRRHGPGHRLSVDQVKAILRDTAEKIDPEGQPFFEYWDRKPIPVAYDEYGHSLAYGYGLVNAARAVCQALEMPAREAAATAVAVRESEGRFVKGSLTLPARLVGDPLALFRKDAVSSPSRQRYESGEHVWIGDRGYELAFTDAELGPHVSYHNFMLIPRRDKNETFRYGELVALSGDFYLTPAELYWERRACIPWLWESNDLSDIRAIFADELKAISEQQLQGTAYPDHNIAFWWNAKGYIELALDNTDHFGWHNLKAYCRYHGDALAFALQARDMQDFDRDKAAELWGQALFTNAFADHFLTDAFAAGHIRVPRREICQWAGQQGYSKELAGALSKLLHDQDGHLKSIHGSGHSLALDDTEGLYVCNSLGKDWHTRCDGQLFVKNGAELPAVCQPVEAVRESVKELLTAYIFGRTPDGVYAATTYVPFPHPKGPGLTDKFPTDIDADRIEQLLDRVKWYIKVPYLSTGLEAKHVKALCAALPGFLEEFRQAVQRDSVDPELVRRLPEALVAGFKAIR